MMILEKAWAIINGGYDNIEGGYNENIFELFLGCKCDSFYNNGTNYITNVIKKIIDLVEENEKRFGTLSLCSCKYYKYCEYDQEKINFSFEDFDKKEAINKGLIMHNKDYHAYTILKMKEIRFETTNHKINSVKFFIISNPHGVGSDFIASGIELKKIEEIFYKNLGVGNRDKYDYILEKNKKYRNTGIIFMPLEYFQEWSNSISICSPHYGYISYVSDIEGELDYLYIYKIELGEQQSFICQVCFQNLRAHRIDKTSYWYECGIKVIINNDDLDAIDLGRFHHIEINDQGYNRKAKFSYHYERKSHKDYVDYTSINEVNLFLKEGQYFIMIYPKCTINKAVIRFLSEKEIDIKLINKFKNNEGPFYQNFSYIFKNDNNDYKQYLNMEENNNLYYRFSKEDFLPGIREYYSLFEALSKKMDLARKDAIYKITEKGDAYYYDIIEPNTLNTVFQRKYQNGKYKDSVINVNTLQFVNNSGIPYKVKNFKELIHEMKINSSPVCCLFSEYDENINSMFSGSVYFKLYHNKALNEDILVITDKKGNYSNRIQKPLFIVIIDVSGSMVEYHNYLQNKIIPKLLKKLGYYSKYGRLLNIMREKNISNLEILQVITSSIKFNKFIEDYNLENINSEDIKKFCEDIVVLITFSDDSNLYFYHVSDFENCYLSGGSTYFENAALNLKMILNSLSKERSVRLLSFSDGLICDINESMIILDEISNSRKAKHQMNSVSVQIQHGTEPDSKILMKLSTFSHPITNMNQEIIEINKEKNEEDVINKLYQRFVNDDMEYYLKLYSDIDLMSNEFSDNFSNVQYLNSENKAIRIRGQRSASEYEKILSLSSGKIVIKDCGELTKNTFYNIMKENAPYIGQRIFERKVNQKGKSKENQEIINYFKKTEEYFDKTNKKNINKKKKIYEYFEEINDKENFKNVKSTEIANIISDIEKDIKKAIDKQNKKTIFLINNLTINNKNKNQRHFSPEFKLKVNKKQNQNYYYKNLIPNTPINYLKKNYYNMKNSNKIIHLQLRKVTPDINEKRKKRIYQNSFQIKNNLTTISNQNDNSYINKNYLNKINEQKQFTNISQNNYQLTKSKSSNNIVFNNKYIKFPRRTGYSNNYGETKANKSFYKRINDNIFSQERNQISELNIDEQTYQIIKKYSLMKMEDPATFNISNFNLFYSSSNYFQIPQSEIKGKKTIIYYIGENLSQKVLYEGCVNHINERHGFGKMTHPNFIKIGMWKNNIFSGWGREIKTNGQIFEGKFNNNFINGKGVYKFKDTLYVGDFKDGKIEGEGILLTKDFKYNGMFKDNKIDGFGIILFLDKGIKESKYEGFFNQNQIEGKILFEMMKKENWI